MVEILRLRKMKNISCAPTMYGRPLAVRHLQASSAPSGRAMRAPTPTIANNCQFSILLVIHNATITAATPPASLPKMRPGRISGENPAA